MTSPIDPARLEGAFAEFDQRSLGDAIPRLLEFVRGLEIDAATHWALIGFLGDRLEQRPAHTLALLAALARDGDMDLRLRTNAVQTLAVHGGEQLLALGPTLLSDPQAIVRAVTVSAIGRLSGPRALTLLLQALNDDAEYWDMWVQRRVMDDAAVALHGDHRGPADGRTKAALSDWAERRVAELGGPARSLAAVSLGAIVDPRALDALAELVAKGDQQALDLLVAFPRAEAIACLLALLPEVPPETVVQVAQALGQLRDPAAIQALATVLADTASPARWAAARGLRTIGSEDAWTVLECYADDPDARVREFAAMPEGTRRALDSLRRG